MTFILHCFLLLRYIRCFITHAKIFVNDEVDEKAMETSELQHIFLHRRKESRGGSTPDWLWTPCTKKCRPEGLVFTSVHAHCWASLMNCCTCFSLRFSSISCGRVSSKAKVCTSLGRGLGFLVGKMCFRVYRLTRANERSLCNCVLVYWWMLQTDCRQIRFPPESFSTCHCSLTECLIYD